MMDCIDIGVRVLLKGTQGDNNEYILKVIKRNFNNIYTVRIKYKSNLSYNKTIRGLEKNYERWYNNFSYQELLMLSLKGVYDAEFYKEALQ